MSPYPARRKQHADGRARTTININIRTCIQQSRAQNTSELQESLQGLGWQSRFGCGAWLPHALHEAGPWWMQACCKAQVSMRALGSACETQIMSVTDISVSHSSLSTLLACFSSSGFCREAVCQAPSGAGDDTD